MLRPPWFGPLLTSVLTDGYAWCPSSQVCITITLVSGVISLTETSARCALQSKMISGANVMVKSSLSLSTKPCRSNLCCSVLPLLSAPDGSLCSPPRSMSHAHWDCPAPTTLLHLIFMDVVLLSSRSTQVPAQTISTTHELHPCLKHCLSIKLVPNFSNFARHQPPFCAKSGGFPDQPGVTFCGQQEGRMGTA